MPQRLLEGIERSHGRFAHASVGIRERSDNGGHGRGIAEIGKVRESDAAAFGIARSSLSSTSSRSPI